MNKKRRSIKYFAKVIKKGKMAQMAHTAISSRFLSFIKAVSFPELKKIPNSHLYIKVVYGKSLDNYGKLREFYNDGEYTNRKDLNLAVRAFFKER